MNKGAFWITITSVFIIYYTFLIYTDPDSDIYCEKNRRKTLESSEFQEIGQNCFYMKYDNFFVCVDIVSESLYLSSNPEEAEQFCIISISDNRNAIKSTSLDKWITIDYENDQSTKKYVEFKISKQYNRDNSIKTKIIKRKNKNLLKFFNGDFLCLDKTSGNFYASKNDKWNIFYFTRLV